MRLTHALRWICVAGMICAHSLTAQDHGWDVDAEHFLQQVEVEEPFELLDEDLEEDPDREDPIRVTPELSTMYEAMIRVQDGLYEEAIPDLEWVIENDPTLMGAWETLGWAYWLTDRRRQAAELWERLVTIAPNEPMGYNLLAQVALQDGDFDRAKELYESSLRLNPEQYVIRYSLARVLLWTGQHQRAAAKLRRLLQEDPDRVDVEIDLAWALYVNEAYEEVIEHWDRINEVIPDNPGFLLARANVLILLGALDEAEADARRALEIEPSNIHALNLLATLAVQTQRPEDAVTALRRVMDHTDDDEAKARIATRIAVYMRTVLDRDREIFTLQQILRMLRISLNLDDQSVSTHLYYGEMLVQDSQYAEAERVFQHVLDEFNPHNRRALFGLLESYFGRSMHDEAEQQLREIFRTFNVNNPFRHIFWARLHFARGRFEDALDRLDRLEHEGSQGAVFSLLYHGVNPSEFSDMPSVRQLQEQWMALRRDGFRFITANELTDYFERKQPATLTDERPWLYRAFQSIRYAWTGERPDEVEQLSDYSPDKIVMVTFDDGLRNSFRYGTEVAQDLNIPLTMFVGVGDVLDPTQHYIASFPEMRDYKETGVWEFQSHLWDAGQLAPADGDGNEVLPLANRLWLPEKERLETLREYQARLQHEFLDSKRVLARELRLDEEEITAVAYPIGDVGQEDRTNIRAFRVPEVILNEAEVSYQRGFIQFRHGYSMKTDDEMLNKRWEPDRNASGRDVLREAYRQHPVFVARRMRAEMAALNGRLHLAERNIELLRRDGYPEEDLADVREYVHRRLGRLAPLPDMADDIADGETPLISLRRPYVGAEARITRANVMIDDREYTGIGGLHLNRRLALQARIGQGRIRQTVETNTFVEVQETDVSSTQTFEVRTENGDVSNVEVDRTTETTQTVQSNVVESTTYRADKAFAGASLNYTHASGAFTIFTLRYDELDGEEIGEEEVFTYGVEHLWRPVPAIDVSARYHHGLVPSAREIIEYDSLSLRPFWRIRDGWEAYGLAHFAYYDDRNSFLKAEMENFWCLSRRHDIWLGVRNSVDTVDRESDLYWTPYWDQRHSLLLRIRRSYPNYYGMLRAHIGMQKSDVRREVRDRFESAKALGEAQGWSPGSGPDTGWSTMLGFSGSVTRTFENGLEASAAATVNAADEYTEHTVSLRLAYYL